MRNLSVVGVIALLCAVSVFAGDLEQREKARADAMRRLQSQAGVSRDRNERATESRRAQPAPSVTTNDPPERYAWGQPPAVGERDIAGRVIQIPEDGLVLVQVDGNDAEMIIVSTPTDNIADGDRFNRKVRPVGMHRYISVTGAAKQVRKYEAVKE